MREEAKNIIDIVEDQPKHNTVVLSKEQFREFHTFLSIIKTHFNDLCIVDGTFRARSNDRSFIVETGFRYFQNINFNIADINLLSKMITALNKNAEISITFTDDYITFTDGYQSAQIPTAVTGYIDNVFVPFEEMYGVFFESLDTDRLLIKETKSKNVVNNISRMTQNLNTPMITVKHNEGNLNKGYLLISGKSGSGVPEYFIKLNEDFINPMTENCYFSVLNYPFIFNKTEMILNFYLDMNRPIIYAIYNTSVDRLFINIYSRASLIEKDE